MATLEDKILGDTPCSYCSSSSDEENDTENSDNKTEKQPPIHNESTPFPEIDKWEGTSRNTGPKGVIKDWQRYKQLEIQKRSEDAREKIELMKKLTLTVKSALDEEKESLDDPDLAELLNDDFLLNYQKQRIEEMLEQTNHNIKFGNVLHIHGGQEFLDAIDKENKTVKIIVHIYEKNVEACRVMNICLQKLSRVYVNVKFCTLIGSEAGMSQKFKIDGVPALLIYKAGNLIGNFIKLFDEFGDTFQPEDVQSFLVEHGMLEDKSCTPLLVRNNYSDSDSSG